MYENEIQELEADAESFRQQIKDAEYWIAHYKRLLPIVYGGAAKADCYDGLDRANEAHDAATNNLHRTLAAIEELKWDEIQDRETLSAYGSLTVDMMWGNQ